MHFRTSLCYRNVPYAILSLEAVFSIRSFNRPRDVMYFDEDALNLSEEGTLEEGAMTKVAGHDMGKK